MLKAFVRRRRLSLCESDTGVRLVGGEFIIVLKNMQEAAFLEMIATQMLEAISQPVVLGDQLLQISRYRRDADDRGRRSIE